MNRKTTQASEKLYFELRAYEKVWHGTKGGFVRLYKPLVSSPISHDTCSLLPATLEMCDVPISDRAEPLGPFFSIAL